MSLFKCHNCGCVENTATSNFWHNRYVGEANLCSECDPSIGKWHGWFDKKPANGMMLGNDGFLYSKEQVDNGMLKWREDNQGFRVVGPA